MRQFAIALSAVSLLSFIAACNGRPPQPQPSEDASLVPPSSVQASAAPREASPSDAASAPASSTPPLPVPDPVASEKGETGARGVLLTWARAIEFGRYGEAWRQWGDAGKRSGMTEAQYAAQFAPYRKVTIGFGDGEVEGGAGSLYYEVPVDFTGERKDGATVKRTGQIVLRRVNDVDGATPAQLRWHIESTTLHP